MIEVFKTNVRRRNDAKRMTRLLMEEFSGYTVNFDLDDCDRILRVVSATPIDVTAVVQRLRALGFDADVLPDEVPDMAPSAL